MFPIIPFLCLAGILGGTGGLLWYDALSSSEQKRADALAGQYAWTLFGKGLEELTNAEARHVNDLTRRHFG